MFMTILEQFPDIQNDVYKIMEQKENDRLNMDFILQTQQDHKVRTMIIKYFRKLI